MRHLMHLFLIVALFSCGMEAGELEQREYPIGFVSHYPLITHEDENVPKTGANVCIVRAPWTLIEPEEGKFDFSLLDKQLDWANSTGTKLIFLMEAGPAHSAGVRWLVEKLKKQGETMASPKGGVIDDPSYQSALYRFYLSRFIRETVSYLKNHKHNQLIYGYSNGCEWWHPLSYSYSKADKEDFRKWLMGKYGSLKRLNERWGTVYKSWDEIQPPVLYPSGIGIQSQGEFVPSSVSCDLCWCTTEESHIPVNPGDKLTVELKLTTENLVCGDSLLEIAWLKADDPRPFRIDWSPPCTKQNGAELIKYVITVPEGASRAWLLMKLRGKGKVIFHSLQIYDEKGQQLAPNPTFDPSLGKWQFIAWSSEQPERVSHSWEGVGKLVICYQPELKLDGKPGYPLAVVDDWFNYRFETFAKFIDWMAEQIVAVDSTRPIVSYITFAFANPFEWDYAQDVAIALDYWAENAKHQHIMGLQINSAEGDFDSLTASVDMVRRYGKPIWAIDLLDFTKGIYLGEMGLTRTSLSLLQHAGADSGIQYYCWFGTPDYNYSELGIEPLKRMIERVKQTALELVGARPVCEVALIQPRMPLYPCLQEEPNDWADFMGWYKLLVRAGICPDIYTLHSLESADLSRYKAVIIPDCAYITCEALRTLRDASGSGVKLISSGRFALYDMSGRKIPSQSLPFLTYRFREPIGKKILGDTYRLKDKGNTPPRLICRSGFPLWELPQVDRALSVLQKSGVSVLNHPAKTYADLTIVPFERYGEKLLFFLPQSDWNGQISLNGKIFNIESLGSIVKMEKE
ncbi:beta-galactosidase [bacterium]|nr:beta-galactosidase [bacterium]